MGRKSLIPAAVLALMSRSDRHAWTLEEIQAGLARAGTPSDFSSVFRAARKLVAEGALRKLALEDGRSCFEPASAHHDHLHCSQCGALVPLPCAIPPKSLSALEAQNGITITDHRVIFTGLCPTCRTGAARRKKRA